nr:ATP-binding protein [Desulfosporosinus youngiae]
MRKITNNEIRMIGNLCWLVLTVNYLWVDESISLTNKILKIILIYVLAEIITGMLIELNNMREHTLALRQSNVKFESAVNELIQFYHSIDFQKSSNSTSDITRELCEYIIKISGVDSAFVWLYSQNGDKNSILLTPENKRQEVVIANESGQVWDNLRNEEEAALVQFGDTWYYLAPVKTATCFYGFIGVFWDEATSAKFKERLHQNVRLLAEWSAIIYERVDTDNRAVKSMIEAERKRIGEEIHDLSSGRLFSAVCATSALAKSEKVDIKDREQLKLITSTVNQALSELRSIIYSLKVTSDKDWLQQIKRYLYEVERLHGVSVSLVISEMDVDLGGQQARALYRIIHEAANNALKHGRCKNLTVEFMNIGEELHLTITDDGKGFEPINSADEHQGLGLINMTSLAHSINAILSIETHLGQGTLIRIVLPNESAGITMLKSG